MLDSNEIVPKAGEVFAAATETAVRKQPLQQQQRPDPHAELRGKQQQQQQQQL